MSLKEISVEELYKRDNKLKKEDVSALKEWIEKQPHLPKITDLQIAIFLHSCYYSKELTKTTIDVHFTIKTMCTDIFQYRDINHPLMQTNLNNICIKVLPQKLPDGSVIIFCKFLECTVDNFIFGGHISLFDMVTMTYIHEYGPVDGIHCVIDIKEIVFGHMLKMNPLMMKKFLYYFQEGLPVRLKGLHYINTVSFMDKLLALMKPFMKKELIDILDLHTNPETLFKTFPKEMFPKDYGGNGDSIEELTEQMRDKIMSNGDFWKFQMSQVVDESKRQEKSKKINEVFGLDGSFKKLDVD